MQLRSSRYLCIIIATAILPIIGVVSQDSGCVSPDSLLEGRRRIVSAVFRASSQRSSYPASEARLDDVGWCSGQLATNIFDPYIEVDFGRDVIFTSVATQGAAGLFTERYRVEVARQDHRHLQYITLSANSSQLEPAIFPLGLSRISNANRHTESLPRPVVGQVLRINPYEWNNVDYACTRLEVYGCPLQECQPESQLNSDQYVDEVTVNDSPINHDNLFEFNNTGVVHCGPNNVGSFDIIISYSLPVLLREIGIHGRVRSFPFSHQYVNSFSLSFSEDGDNFTEYIRDTGSTVFTVSDARRHYFGLWPLITASSLKITINSWNDQPCMGLLMLGCNYSDVVDHSVNISNGTDSGIDSDLLDDMTVVLTTTQSVTTTETVVQTTTENFTQTTTESFTETTTESFTIYRTVTVDVTHTPSPSPSQSSSAAASTSCSSDDDNTPIYVAVVIVIVGLLITIIVVIVGVILCRRYQKEKEFSEPGSSGNSTTKVKYRPAKCDSNISTRDSIVEVANDLYGKEEPQPQSQSSPESPEDNERAQILLYDDADAYKRESGVIETADNPQYGEVTKRSDSIADPDGTENIYSYAVP